ncbi:hypothetical protein D3C78_1953870 [compost metagenome]
MLRSRAMGPNSTSIFLRMSRPATAIGVGRTAPLSMREISSSALMMSSTAVSDASMELARSASPVSLERSISVEV